CASAEAAMASAARRTSAAANFIHAVIEAAAPSADPLRPARTSPPQILPPCSDRRIAPRSLDLRRLTIRVLIFQRWPNDFRALTSRDLPASRRNGHDQGTRI